MLQTRSRIYFTSGGTLKMGGKIDKILNHSCYVVVYSSTMIGPLYPDICFGFRFYVYELQFCLLCCMVVILGLSH